MSKKDFIALADMIRAHNRSARRDDMFGEDIAALAEFCREQNPAFMLFALSVMWFADADSYTGRFI